jgi:hypothetical protein
MKKQIIIFFLIILQLSSWSQKSITTDVPCTDVMAQNEKGRWVKTKDPSTTASKEINATLADFHKLLMMAYPQPTGVDAAWHTAEGISYFGSKSKNSPYPDGRPRYISVELPHFRMYYYKAGFFAYRCDPYNDKKMNPGYPGETATWVTISGNKSDPAISGGVADESWMINDIPVRLLNPGTRLFSDDGLKEAAKGRNYRIVLIHRKGILPYIPVTRKQYLERCMIVKARIYDDMINAQEQLPVRTLEEQEKEKNAKLAQYEKDYGKDPKRLKSAVDYYLSGYKTDQQVRDEQVQKIKTFKAQELKKFTDELEKSSEQGLLDAPAMIRVMYDANLIFDTDPLYASMVVIENRDYIRKELPKHVPQLFVVNWEWSNWPPQEKIDEIMEKDFPFEKLQAMIDK